MTEPTGRVRNIAPDGLPLLYSFPHEPECRCIRCQFAPEFVEAMARYVDEHPFGAGVEDE